MVRAGQGLDESAQNWPVQGAAQVWARSSLFNGGLELVDGGQQVSAEMPHLASLP
eukprot:CAMPEP_0115504536 /NCGR_PEP_ID=MMETSP0271-20121206/70071_1 /TAXON_ID=71861 /ORGANISM="Scrippsiella trochoidea, Strain CCMP3099" /LENGTH=54 /DNA_ID=CAMNT_0002933719 /DNA_START=40 /DNA_END=205 /DNA_ORIENTATION=+